MPVFQYHPEIITRYPTLVGGVILARGLTNGPTPAALQTEYAEEQRAVAARIGSTPLSELAPMAAWRKVFHSFGVDPTKYRNAAEALLRRLIKQGNIPSINTLVDLGNLISIRYAFPVCVIDRQQVQGAITVHFADGSERYTLLGESTIDHPDQGEVVFTDETKMVIARRWCWRQSEQSAAKDDTTDVIITVEAHHAGAESEMHRALEDFAALLQRYAGGETTSVILGQRQAAI